MMEWNFDYLGTPKYPHAGYDSSGCTWIICLWRTSTNSLLSENAPEDISRMMHEFAASPNLELPAKIFDAITQWAADNYPQWAVINVVSEQEK